MYTTQTLYYFSCARTGFVYASTEFAGVSARRDAIDATTGGCPEPHPIRHKEVRFDLPPS